MQNGDAGIKVAKKVSLCLEGRGRGAGSGAPSPGRHLAPRVILTRLLTLGALAVCLLALTATPALAEQKRIFTGAFGCTEGAAGCTTPDPYPLADANEGGSPWGVAVDESSGDVYATDPKNHRVEEFSSAGVFLLMFGEEVNANPLAADRDVCTALESCQPGVAGSTPGAFGGGSNALYVAVDNAVGGEGDVYVGTRDEQSGAGNVVQKFTSEGALISGWGEEGRLNGSSVTTGIGAPFAGPFDELNGIAVDTKGNLWVYGTGFGEHNEEGRVFEFTQAGVFAGNDWATGENPHVGFAVDPEENVYTDNGFSLEKFTATGARIGQVTETGVQPEAVAVDPATGDLFVGTGNGKVVGGEEGNRVLRYAQGCHIRGLGEGTGCVPAEEFTSAHLGQSRGLAVDGSVPEAPIYTAETRSGRVAGFALETVPVVSTVPASGFAAATAVLNGKVNPSGVQLNAGVAGCRFEWGEAEKPYDHVVGCESETPIEGSSPVPVYKTITGLVAGHSYHFRLVAGNEHDVNPVLEVDEPSVGLDLSFGPPLVKSESVSEVTATSVVFGASVAPNSVDTHVRVQYSTEPVEVCVAARTCQETSVLDLGSGEAAQTVSLPVQGLVADTVYHYRVVAESALGEGPDAVRGEDHTFTTQRAVSTGESTLADGRGWELVSPADKHGAAIEPIVAELNLAIQASAGGGGFTYVTTTSTEADPAGNSNLSQVLSTRAAGGGWSSEDIAVAHGEATGLSSSSQEYRVFSDDLSVGLLQPFGGFDAALSGEASEQTPYLRDDADGSFRPLVTAAPGGDVPEEVNGQPVRFGVPQLGDSSCPPEAECGPQFLGATPGFDHVVFSSRAPLVEGAPENMVYEWSAGTLGLVSVLPDGQPDVAGAVPKLGQYGIARSSVVRNAISTDGSLVVWEDEKDSRLFLRDMASGETILIGSGRFQGASSDDSRIFFGELNECEVVEEPGNLHCVDKTLGSLTGTMIGSSEDGSFVYYVSGGRELTVFHDGVSEPVAELSNEDEHDWDGNVINEPLPFLTARVSPDGRWLAFMSNRELTGYDNHDAVSGVPDQEVFLYHAAAGAGEPGRLVCASCNPTGERPHGIEAGRLQEGVTGETGGARPTALVAASVPGWTSDFYQSRYLSDGGRLFFDSSDALVPQDVNGTEDVYEYEPPVGGEETPDGDTCAVSSSTYSAASGGCVSLISSGLSPEESGFLDASGNGDDVFFLTSAQLSPGRDHDTALDVYDARVGGGEPEQVKPVECQGDACQPSVPAPIHPTPGSLTFNGPGNLTPAAPVVVKPKTAAQLEAEKLAKALKVCAKDKQKSKRAKCQKQAKQKYGAKTKAKKASHKGRAKS
jgi:hypothetical protein